ERSGAKFLIVCSTPLSNRATSFEVIGAVEPLAREATTFSTVEASDVGWARRPAWANSVLNRQAAVTPKTIARHQAEGFPAFFPGLMVLGVDCIFDPRIQKVRSALV